MCDFEIHDIPKSVENGSRGTLPIVLKPQDRRDELKGDCTSGISASS